ncbi:MAG: AMP-dependent synthetase/ligase [Fimbriimonas sp.]
MEAKSLGDVLRRTARRVPKKVALLVPDKGNFTPVTYEGMLDTVRAYAGAIRALGLKRGDRLGILSENCVEWAYADWACYSLGIVSVPIYPTLPPDQVAVIVRDSGAGIVVCGAPDQAKKLEGLEGVQGILLKGEGDTLAARAAGPAGQAMPLGELNKEIDATRPDDLATLIYTSGTTGQPKGAMMPHRAFMHVAWSAERHLPLNEGDTFLCILPMSHVYERVAGQVLPCYLGATVAYAKSIASIAGDMLKVKPTVMLCVPRFLESFRDRAMDGVGKLPPLRQKLFHLGMAQGVKKARGQFAPLAGLLDKLVMGKLRERVGGRMRYFVSGGAALAPHVAEFYMGTGLTVLQGYGLTETAGGSVVNHPERNRYWTVGEPLDMEIDIAADGEILMKGPGLFLGYWNLPEETAKAVDDKGWFHTGDIGEWEGTNLKITDRKKDLIVLGNGKNVAPQPIENKIKASPFIEEAVLFGDGMEHCIALIVPKADAVRAELGLADDVSLSTNDAVKALIKKEMDQINKTLASYELVKRHAILDNSFSIENGELTPSLKVKRRVVREKYANRLAELKR